jgi:NAD(P)-dependent dehydrogenase (short-subunit alcohol dehydrogenase family)
MAVALIVGVGAGLSASLARALRGRGYDLVLAARSTADLADLAAETGATVVEAEAGSRADMARLFEVVDARGSPLEVAIYNPSARVRGPIAELDPEAVEGALRVTAYGAFLMAHHAAKRMLAGHGRRALFFTGASAGVKGFANSAPFAMGKFALRGLCQSLARELHPAGIHVGHVVVDGGIGRDPANDAKLDPDALAAAYLALLDQPRSTWAWEIELRPWVEPF